MFYINLRKNINRYLLPANCVTFFYIWGKETKLEDFLETVNDCQTIRYFVVYGISYKPLVQFHSGSKLHLTATFEYRSSE